MWGPIMTVAMAHNKVKPWLERWVVGLTSGSTWVTSFSREVHGDQDRLISKSGRVLALRQESGDIYVAADPNRYELRPIGMIVRAAIREGYSPTMTSLTITTDMGLQRLVCWSRKAPR